MSSSFWAPVAGLAMLIFTTSSEGGHGGEPDETEVKDRSEGLARGSNRAEEEEGEKASEQEGKKSKGKCKSLVSPSSTGTWRTTGKDGDLLSGLEGSA
jgi:hypothetical protein